MALGLALSLLSIEGLATSCKIALKALTSEDWSIVQNVKYGEQVSQLSEGARRQLKEFRRLVAEQGLGAAERRFPVHELTREWAGHRALALEGQNSPYRVIYRIRDRQVEIVRVIHDHSYRQHPW